MRGEDPDVLVVGAGIAGLVAAGELHRAGRSVAVHEAADAVGGRVRTDLIDGFRLDRGFQVLLPAYPQVKRQLDLDALRPHRLVRGALIDTDRGRRLFAPPGTHPVLDTGVPSTLLGWLREHPADAAKIAAWTARDLLSPALVRRAHDTSVAHYLSSARISPWTVDQLLRPFLAGVFLDPELAVSNRLFHLVWRSFVLGGAVLPEQGMQAVPDQLAAGLPAGTITLSSRVEAIEPPTGTAGDWLVRLAGGDVLRPRAVVVATDGDTAATLLPEVTAPRWSAQATYYFRVPEPPATAPVLALDGTDSLLLNAIVNSAIVPGYAPPGSALVAATVPGRAASAEIERRVLERLARLYDTQTRDWELITTYDLPQALPRLAPAEPFRRPIRLANGCYVCGDHRDTPSLQGAMASGERVARAVSRDLARVTYPPRDSSTV
ncbi:FAD-dependent oxidoreductase [Pseudonocardiaceae bacterium YIM PH 21723]|nr:FAD-dependent oxidoreductase [Pseudonocardiaceae bacterium YIM PH 21723]